MPSFGSDDGSWRAVAVFLDNHGALFDLRDLVRDRLSLLLAVVVFRHTVAVAHTPQIALFLDPDR